MKKYLTTNEYCEIYRISRVTLYRHLKSGIIPHIKLGKRILIPNDENQEIEKKVVVKKNLVKPIIPELSDLESLLNPIFSELIEALKSPPPFGSVYFEVKYHDGKPVLIDCGKRIKKRLEN